MWPITDRKLGPLLSFMKHIFLPKSIERYILIFTLEAEGWPEIKCVDKTPRNYKSMTYKNNKDILETRYKEQDTGHNPAHRGQSKLAHGLSTQLHVCNIYIYIYVCVYKLHNAEKRYPYEGGKTVLERCAGHASISNLENIIQTSQ